MPQKISVLQKKFIEQAQKKRRRIAIGIWRKEKEIVGSIQKAARYADITVVGTKIQGVNSIPTKNDEEASQVIIDLVKSGKVEGFTRAQLKDSYTNHLFQETFKIKNTVKKVSPCIIAKGDQYFILCNGSNYNSLIAKDQLYEATRTIQWMEKDLKIKPKIGIASTRRLSGKVGAYGLLEEIAKNSEQTARALKRKGYDVTEYYIEYENAIWDKKNLIIASIGLVGNPWAKALCYLGGWQFVHCPYLDQNVYYDNTPRNNENWFWPIISTAAWIARGTVKI